MDEHELLAEALAASAMAVRATARLANPALERLQRAAVTGTPIARSEIAFGQRLAVELAEAEARALRLREAARQRTGG